MKIAFKAVNGFCPSFKHGNDNYFIKEIDWVGEWKWQLYKKLTNKEVRKFETNSDVNEFLKDINASFMERYSNYVAYQNKNYLIKLENKTITMIHKEQPIGYVYNTYVECLNAAKRFLETIITEKEQEAMPQQISFFDLAQ